MLPISFLEWSTVNASQQDVIFDQTFDCVIYPSVVAELGSSVTGVLKVVNAKRSQFVKRGEVVAQLESKAERAALELVQARVDSTLEIEFRQANASHVERQYSRINETSTEDIFSREELDARKTDANLGQIQLAQAQENKRFLKLELEQAKELLDRRSILSPFDGFVTEQLKYVGEFVDGEAVMRVAQLDPLHVETIVPASYIGQLKPGMQATIRSVTDSDTRYAAKVDLIDQVVDVASGTFGVRLSLNNPDYAITAGLRCTVKFEKTPQYPAAALPMETSGKTRNYEFSGNASGSELDELDDGLSDNSTFAKSMESSKESSSLPAEHSVDVAKSKDLINVCAWPQSFNSRKAAEEAMSSQEEIGVSLQVEEKVISEDLGHTVISPVFDSKTAAFNYMGSLEDKGIKDFALMAKTQDSIRVSLGAYKNAEGAKSRLEDLLRQDISAQVIPWKRYTTDFVVSLTDSHLRSKQNCAL